MLTNWDLHRFTTNCANIIPKENFSNYGPISLLPPVSKLLVTIVDKQFCFFLKFHYLLYGNQFGFRRKHNTIDAVTKSIGDTCKALDENEAT